MNKITCCFTEHRSLPKNSIEEMLLRLNAKIDFLIGCGVTNVISGGALGFDQIAVSSILDRKSLGSKIQLVFALPCKNSKDEIFIESEYFKLMKNM